tara:strand:- start:267 stop:842 length:576 start_codon:yes stop_codon:yes gene_type:complete
MEIKKGKDNPYKIKRHTLNNVSNLEFECVGNNLLNKYCKTIVSDILPRLKAINDNNKKIILANGNTSKIVSFASFSCNGVRCYLDVQGFGAYHIYLKIDICVQNDLKSDRHNPVKYFSKSIFLGSSIGKEESTSLINLDETNIDRIITQHNLNRKYNHVTMLKAINKANKLRENWREQVKTLGSLSHFVIQ